MNKNDIPLNERKITTIGYPNIAALSKESKTAFYKELLRIIVEEYNADKDFCRKYEK